VQARDFFVERGEEIIGKLARRRVDQREPICASLPPTLALTW
jgi:hypothetical protein